MIGSGRTSAALTLWARAAGLALWAPAVAIPGSPVPLQAMDAIALAAWPLVSVFARRLTGAALAVLVTGIASVLLAWTTMGGEPLILAWTLGFAFPFVAALSLVAGDARSARAFVAGFLVGGALSALFFIVQLMFGAEALDFRSNPAFRLPPHYGRGFALFPEVSTFAAHIVIAFGTAAALALHPASRPAARWRAMTLTALALGVALVTRSSTVVVLLPAVAGLAVALTTRASLNAVILVALLTGALLVVLTVFVEVFYVARLETDAAQRSASMRLASILGGLSPLWSGELFGVGIGNNAEVKYRAYEVARALGLSFGALPEGVNAQIVGRVFEEGWPVVLHFAIAGAILARALAQCRTPDRVALICIAVGAGLAAATTIGYRGIYTTWIWLAIPAGLLLEAEKGHAVTARVRA